MTVVELLSVKIAPAKGKPVAWSVTEPKMTEIAEPVSGILLVVPLKVKSSEAFFAPLLAGAKPSIRVQLAPAVRVGDRLGHGLLPPEVIENSLALVPEILMALIDREETLWLPISTIRGVAVVLIGKVLRGTEINFGVAEIKKLSNTQYRKARTGQT